MSKTRPKDLVGIVPAIVLPLKKDYSIDEPVLRRYVRWIVKQGVKAIAINTDAGEGSHLNRDERKQVLRIVVSEVKHRIPVVAGLAANHTAEAVELGLDAKRAGADVLLVFPLPSFRGSRPDKIVHTYHQTINQRVRLPMILFQLQPDLGGVNYSPSLLTRLVNLDMVVAIKEASFDRQTFSRTTRLIRRLSRLGRDSAPAGQGLLPVAVASPKRITILTGNDNFIYESFVRGGDGALIGFGAIATAMQVRMFHAWQAHDLKTASVLGRRVQRLADVIFAPPVRDYRVRLKEALVMQGIFKKAVIRPPLLPMDAKERKRIHQALIKAGEL